VRGGGIGPLKFLVYINELATVLERYDIKVKPFADDLKLYLHILTMYMFCSYSKLLSVDAVVAWANEWQQYLFLLTSVVC